MVDSRDVKKHVEGRVASLSASLAKEFELHWNAYAARPGPRAYGRNTLKLASRLAGGGQAGVAELRVSDPINDVLDLALLLEGADLETVSEAEQSVRLAGGNAAALTPPMVEQMVAHLHQLAETGAAAADELGAYRP
jgi:hypothetical protein